MAFKAIKENNLIYVKIFSMKGQWLWYIGVFCIFLLVVLVFAYFLISSKQKIKLTVENKTMGKVQKIKIRTVDGVNIVGDYYPVEAKTGAFILIHMRPATKESFKELALFLQEKKYAVLAIDLRGHGESIYSVKGLLDYKKMQPDEERLSIFDLEAASAFLEQEGFDKEKQILIGASIGANLSFQFLSEHPEIAGVVLLSPGSDYRGIVLAKYKDKVKGEKLMTIIAKDDLDQSLLAEKELRNWYPTTSITVYESGGHGTNILEKNKDAFEKIYFWANERLSSAQ